MAALTITRDTYRDKVYGGWLGKNIGGTLGAPFEGRKEILKLSFYDPVPGQATANDDLDIQLVWLHALRNHGIHLTSNDLAAEWQDHVTYPFDEYGYAVYNLRRGLKPPITGAFNNWFRHGMGAAIRAEIWAMIAPGAPQIAAGYAWRDGSLDHAEEGVWAEMFLASVESTAFFLSDPQRLLDTGLALIPANCRTARAVRIARDAWRERVSAVEARGRIIREVGHDNFTDAPQNIGFIVLGWLYGEGDFGRSLCAAVNCGYDTDSTGATLGAILGIIHGRSGLPADWLQPIGDAVVLGWGVVNLEVERTTEELTEHTMEFGERVLAEKCPHVALVEAIVPVSPPPPVSIPESEPPPTPPSPAIPPSPSAEPTPVALPPLDPPAGNARARFLELDAIPPEAPAVPPPLSPDETLPATAAAGTSMEATSHEATAPSPETAVPPPAPDPAPAPPVETAIDWLDSAQVKPLLVVSPYIAVYNAGPFEMTVDYGEGGPAIAPNVATSLSVAIRNRGATEFMGRVNLSVPSGWQVAVPGAQGQRQMLAPGGMARYGFVVRVPETVTLQERNTVTLVLTPENGPATTCDIFLLGGTCWWWVGPFQNQMEEGFFKAYAVEDKPGFDQDYLGRGATLIRWRKLAYKENTLPLERDLFTGSPGVAYGVMTLHVPTQTEARVVAHSNDGVKVWLNNQTFIQWHSHDTFRPTFGYGPAQADVVLRPGDNRLMVKVVRCGDPVEFSLSIVDRQGMPLMGLGNTKW